MARLPCNARARGADAAFRAFWPTVTAVTRKSAQRLAPFALFFSVAMLAATLTATTGCASSAPAASSASSASAASTKVEGVIDAVLPVGEGYRVFRLGTLRHAKVSGTPDTASVTWLKLAAPAGAFRPVQAVPAQRGYFLLVDAASSRLCLYDESAGLISTFPMPEAFTPFPAGRVAVFRGADGAFTFVDYAAGEAWQFADRQTSGPGTTQWISRGNVKLPAGLRACMQPPGSEELYCRGGDGSPLRFDGALNRVPAYRDPSDSRSTAQTSATWDAESGEWALEGRAADGATLFRFLPAQRRWQRIPLSPAPSPAP